MDRSIFAQKINSDGDRLWGDDDILLWNRSGVTINDVFSDCAGGAIVAMWSHDALYLQQINGNGEIGDPLTVPIDGNLSLPTEIIISTYPNPCNNYVNISILTPQALQGRLFLMDVVGHNIGLANQINTSKTLLSLDLTNYPSGQYIIQYKSNGELFGQALQIVK